MEKPVKIEEAFSRLDEIIEKLEGGELSMEESFALYGEGLSLVKSCRGSIDETEKKLKILEEDGGSDGV